MSESKKPYCISDLRYYFDSQQRDLLDRGSQQRRNAEVLAVRDSLFRLDDVEFAAALKIIQSLARDGKASSSKRTQKSQIDTSQTKQLIDLTRKHEDQHSLADESVNPQ